MTEGGRSDWSRTGAGGMRFNSPWGESVAANITPSRARGIGGWSDAQIIRAITRGVAADGRRLFPPMGFAYYARMDQRDLRDLVAYLRSLPAVE